MMTQKMPTSALLLFLLLLLTFLRPSFSTRRRILHQPFQPQDSSPPSKPPIPSPPASPKYPFSGSTPADSDSPFFPSYPSSPLPPSSSSSQASFPANVSSLSVPRASGPSSASSKLAVAAVAAVIAAVAVVSLAAFLHLRRRSRSRGSSSFDRSKTQRSDSSSAVSFSNHHIPKLPRPPQTSSEFLYLGTLVSSHVPAGGAAAFNNASSASAATNQSNASSDSRKTDSPELRPLPPLITHQVPRAKSGDAANAESEEFYSPKGSVNGRGSSIDTGSASRRAFAAVDLEDFNGSASPTYSSSSSVSGSGPGSPVRSHSSRYSIPDSPDLIEIQTISPSSSSPEKDSRRSVESSPRISEYNTESQSPVKIIAAIPSPPEIGGSLFPESESSPRNSGFSDLKSESPPRIPTDSVPEIESPGTISSPIQSTTIEIPIPPPPQEAQVQESASLPTTCSTKCEQSPPRNSIDSPEIIAETSSTLTPTPPQMQNSELPTCEESPPRIQHNAATGVPPPPPPKSLIEPPGLISPIELPSDLNGESSIRTQHNAATFIPPPPPPPPRKVWESPKTPTPPAKRPIGPPSLINPLRPISFESPTSMSPMELPSNDPQMDNKDFPNQETEYSREDADQNSNTFKPKLKQLHWDKVRASSDREMVWDQFKCSSFKLNEEMIETLFVANTPKPKPNPNESTRWQVLPLPGQDNGNRVLDPKKAQNIAILLKALHVTVDEVCEGLLEGNADILGTDLLESLLKMAPTKEEERKLQEYKEEDDKDSPTKLGPAERFLKAVVDIPYAFKRVEAMLYISTFDSEVEYLKKSFETLESACEELRSSRMFLKLLEAVLKTGNRMNVGTNRGDAHAFKLDTLLKLADVKAADGKTTLLHFVVQEIIRTEGSHQNNDDARCRKLVSSLSSELSNVKKAAVMDAEVVSADVAKLSKGIENVKEMIGKIGLDGGEKFWENMRGFVRKGEEEIFRVRAQESLALSLVKEITEYFHGDSGKEEAHPFRIFVVVREFLGVLDRVCKEVGMINERTVVSSPHMFPVPVNPMLQQAASGMFSID